MRSTRAGTRAEITQKFGVVVGMAGANLKVERGEISVLMGLSGSGKSTLLRAANGIAPVTRGQVLVNDGANVVDVAECDAATLRRVRRPLHRRWYSSSSPCCRGAACATMSASASSCAANR